MMGELGFFFLNLTFDAQGCDTLVDRI
jgi:hypothetical protein